jgi:hypothetical protein
MQDDLPTMSIPLWAGVEASVGRMTWLVWPWLVDLPTRVGEAAM